MSRPNLRQKPRVCYYELEEPNFDEYTYCDECSDYVYEYCAIHGPLLVIPDDKVISKTSYPPYVPLAALTIPQVFLHLAPSIIPGAGLGVFSTLTLPRGVRFGPYCGKRTQNADSMYCWQIYDSNKKRSHVVDAVDADRSNWMRYVNCARHWKEQNLLAYQYQGQLYYRYLISKRLRTIKIIPRFTELMVFYGSEYANALRINLSLYNSPLGYARTFGTTKGIEIKNKEHAAIDVTEVPHYNMKNKDERNYEIEEYISTNDFETIDETYDQKQNYKNNVDTSIVLNDKAGDYFDKNSSIEVSFSGDNININFNNINEEKIYKCHICDKTFGKSKNLKEHITRHYYKFNCDICNYKTNSENRFTEHVENHTKVFEHNCNLCFYKTNNKTYFNRHCRRHQGIEKQVIKTPSTSADSDHSKNTVRQCEIFNNINEDKTYKCHICYKTFGKSKCLKEHIKRHYYKFNCDLCNYKINSKNRFDEHIENHTKVYKYNCNICFYKTNNKRYYNRHCRRHPSQGIEKQVIKSPITRTDLKNRSKNSVRQCEMCEFNTLSSRRFSIHMSQHRGNIYKCNQCDYSNHAKYNLKRHIVRNHL